MTDIHPPMKITLPDLLQQRKMTSASIALLLSHYFVPETPKEIKQAQAKDWLDDLIEFGTDVIQAACREWRRSRSHRPTPADIRKLALEIQASDARKLALKEQASRVAAPVIIVHELGEAGDRLCQLIGRERFRELVTEFELKFDRISDTPLGRTVYLRAATPFHSRLARYWLAEIAAAWRVERVEIRCWADRGLSTDRRP